MAGTVTVPGNTGPPALLVHKNLAWQVDEAVGSGETKNTSETSFLIKQNSKK